MSGPASVRAGAAQCASAHRVSRASGGARLAIGHMLLACGCGWRADGGVAGAGTRIECRGRQCMVDVRRLRDRSSTSIGLCCCWSTAPCPSRLLPSRMRTRSARRGPCMLTLAGKWTRAGVRAARPAHSETTCMHSAQAPGHTHMHTRTHAHTHTHMPAGNCGARRGHESRVAGRARAGISHSSLQAAAVSAVSDL